MATIRLVPSTYAFSNTSYMSISNASNMYNNTDNTNYATVTHSNRSTTTYYIYLRGFNFSSIPSGAIINSFTVKFKAYEKSLSTSTSYAPKICNGTTTLTCSCNMPSTSAQTLTFSGITATFDTIKNYGSNFGIRIAVRRSSKNTQGYLYIYGAEILVDYTLPGSEQMMIKNNGTWQNVTTVFKKVNGSWIEQTNLTDLFDTSANYIKGN